MDPSNQRMSGVFIVKPGSGDVDHSYGWFNFSGVENGTGDGDHFLWLVLLVCFGVWIPLAI